MSKQEKKFTNPFALNFDKNEKSESKQCESCKQYVLAANQTVCPSCGHDHAVVVKSGNNTMSFDQFKYQGKSGFKLIPHNEDDKPIEFPGDAAELKRSNLDPNDMSISSEAHAHIYNENGKWMIENKSSNEALFLQVKGSMEISTGTVIIIGQSKVFTFDAKND